MRLRTLGWVFLLCGLLTYPMVVCFILGGAGLAMLTIGTALPLRRQEQPAPVDREVAIAKAEEGLLVDGVLDVARRLRSLQTPS